MFRTTHIRTKIAVALAVPMAALVAVAGFEVLDSKADVDQAKAQAELAETALGPGALVVHLQDERNLASIDLIGLADGVDLGVASTEARAALTDPAAVEFREEMDSHGAALSGVFDPAWEAYEGLGALRDDIDAYNGPKDTTNEQFADEVFQRYTTIIEAFFDGTSQVVTTVDDADLRNGAAIVDAATRQTEMQARIVRSIVVGTITGDLDDLEVRQEVAALFDRSQGFDDTIRANSVGLYAGVGDETFAEAGVQSFNRQVEGYLAGRAVEIDPLLDAVASDPSVGLLGTAQQGRDRPPRRRRRQGRRGDGPDAALLGHRAGRAPPRPPRHLGGEPLHHPAAAVAQGAGRGDGQRPPAGGRAPDPRHTAG